MIGQWVEQVLACVLSALLLASGLNKCLRVSQLRSLLSYSKTLFSSSLLGPSKSSV